MDSSPFHSDEGASAHEVGASEQRLRLDRFLREVRPDLSRRAIERLLRTGAVRVEGVPRGRDYFVKRGERIEVRADARAAAGAAGAIDVRRNERIGSGDGTSCVERESPDGGAPRLILRTPQILIVAKPPGMTTNPAVRGERSLLDWARAAVAGSTTLSTATAAIATAEPVPGTGAAAAHPPGILHRLDRDASGLVLFSLAPEGHRLAVAAMRRHRVERSYLVLVSGRPLPAAGAIEIPLARNASGKVIAREDGTPAITRYRTLATQREATLLEARPQTGRMHQIRAHLAAIGYPVAGDPLYGDPRATLDAPRLWLHAVRLQFPLPLARRLGLPREVECPLWEDLAAHLGRLGMALPDEPS
jgi:23S rRNA-/tRNA-specific pseudouridylate synthase